MKTLYDEPLNKMASDETRSSSHEDSIAHPISALKQTPFRSDLLRSLRTSSSDVETLSMRPITSVRSSPRVGAQRSLWSEGLHSNPRFLQVIYVISELSVLLIHKTQ